MIATETKESAILGWLSRRSGAVVKARSRDYLSLKVWLLTRSLDWWDQDDQRRSAATSPFRGLLDADQRLALDSALRHVYPESSAAMKRRNALLNDVSRSLEMKVPLSDSREMKRRRDRLREHAEPVLSDLMARDLGQQPSFIECFQAEFDRSAELSRYAATAAQAAHELALNDLESLAEVEALRNHVRSLRDEDLAAELGRAERRLDLERRSWAPHLDEIRGLLGQLSDKRYASDEDTTVGISTEGLLTRAFELIVLGNGSAWGLPADWVDQMGRVVASIQRELEREAGKSGLMYPDDVAGSVLVPLLERVRRHLVRRYLSGRGEVDPGGLEHWARSSAKPIYQEVCERERRNGNATVIVSIKTEVDEQPEDFTLGLLVEDPVLEEVHRSYASRPRLYRSKAVRDAVVLWIRQEMPHALAAADLKGIEPADRARRLVGLFAATTHLKGPDAAAASYLLHQSLTGWMVQVRRDRLLTVNARGIDDTRD